MVCMGASQIVVAVCLIAMVGEDTDHGSPSWPVKHQPATIWNAPVSMNAYNIYSILATSSAF